MFGLTKGSTVESLNPLDQAAVANAFDQRSRAQADVTEAERHFKTFRFGEQTLRAKKAEEVMIDAQARLAEAERQYIAARAAAVAEIRAAITPDYRSAVRAVTDAVESVLIPRVREVIKLRELYQANNLNMVNELMIEDWPAWLIPNNLKEKCDLLRQNTGL